MKHKEDILIIITEGDYSNCDAYESVLTYLVQKQYPSGYGISIPITRDTCIYDYYSACNASKHFSERYLWHFIVSFKNKQNDKFKLLMAANQIASLFAPNYQVIYAFDQDTDNDHVHFAVNAYSYHPSTTPLCEEMIISSMEQIKQILKNAYPYYSIDYKRK